MWAREKLTRERMARDHQTRESPVGGQQAREQQARDDQQTHCETHGHGHERRAREQWARAQEDGERPCEHPSRDDWATRGDPAREIPARERPAREESGEQQQGREKARERAREKRLDHEPRTERPFSDPEP